MFVEKIVGDLGDKRQWRQYRARVRALPAGHRTTVEAQERYLTYVGVIAKGGHFAGCLDADGRGSTATPTRTAKTAPRSNKR